MICPSFGKACGIARYSNYVTKALESAGYTVVQYRSSRQLMAAKDLKFDVVLVQHEYGFFDSFSELGTGETTAELIHNLTTFQVSNPGSRTGIIMHTVVVQDHVLNVVNQQIFGSIIPVFHLTRSGALEI